MERPPQFSPSATEKHAAKKHSVLPEILCKHPSAAHLVASLANLTDKQVWKIYHTPLVQNNPVRREIIKAILFDRFVPDTLRIVHSYVANHLPKRSLVDAKDLEQEALMEMFKYLDKYNSSVDGPGGGNTFMQYFNAHRLMGSIIDTLRRLMNCNRDTAEDRKRLRPLMEAYRQQYGHNPTDQELRETYPESNKLLDNPMINVEVFNQSGGAGNSDQENGMETHETNGFVTKSAKSVKSSLTRLEAEQKILSVISPHLLNEERLAVLWYRFMGKNMKWISQRLGCSLSSAVNKRRRGEEKIKRHFNPNDITELFE